jgi:hypothetical protein
LYSSCRKRGESRTRNPSPMRAIGTIKVTSQERIGKDIVFIFPEDFTSEAVLRTGQGVNNQTLRSILFFASRFAVWVLVV